MLARVNDPDICVTTQTVEMDPSGLIFVKVLSGPQRTGRKAIYIHGGGGGGNHTLIERPSRRLIHMGLFDTILLPDRRGDGASSPLTHPYTIHEHANDMCQLLDRLGELGPVTAMGVSYGGPIALGLASVDPRVNRVILVASSPSLSQNNGISRFLLKSNILRSLMKTMYRRYLGKLPPGYTDFDPAYDAHTSNDLAKIFIDALKRTPKERLDSFLFSLDATLDEAHASLADDIRLMVPVVQVIGNKDEVWGSTLLPEYRERFPNFKQYKVAEGKIHKDVFLKPLPFQLRLEEALRETFASDPENLPSIN